MVTPRGSWVLEHERVLAASPERVFRMLTEPNLLASWWGPTGFTTPEVVLDVQPGGSYRFTMQPPEGEAFHVSGEYVRVDPVEKLSFSFRWDEPTADDRETLVELSLTPLGEGTRLELRQGEFATEERLELHREGWAQSLDRLEAGLGPT